METQRGTAELSKGLHQRQTTNQQKGTNFFQAKKRVKGKRHRGGITATQGGGPTVSRKENRKEGGAGPAASPTLVPKK